MTKKDIDFIKGVAALYLGEWIWEESSIVAIIERMGNRILELTQALKDIKNGKDAPCAIVNRVLNELEVNSEKKEK